MHIKAYHWPNDYTFEWDAKKEADNIAKHGFSFREASEIFKDPRILFLEDGRHSREENRFYAIGRTQKGVVLTVRYTQRENTIRIFGAAVWRKWRRFYEKRKNS